MTQDRSLERIRWRCRRGLLELDIVLGRFVDERYTQLDEKGCSAFEVLLDMPDNALWDLISGKTDAPPGAGQALVEQIRAM